MRAFMIAAASRSSGKSTVAMGIAAALVRRGLAVRTFKKGPDFIDPQWLAAASCAPCRNLDARLQGRDGLLAYWRQHARGDVSIIEGNQGLHDGVDGDSNAALAKLLDLPVVLVMDARGMGRTAAALALGLRLLDRQTKIAGIVLNRVAGERHEATLRPAIEGEAGVRVFGAIPDLGACPILQRHLGLMPPNECGGANGVVARLADAIAASIDLDGILGAAAELRAGPLANGGRSAPGAQRVRIGISRDRAFGFYYPDDLEALQAAGAVLVPFDTLRDACLPAVDGVFLGGGFPESCARALEANGSLRAGLRGAIEGGLPVYAECGGLMYLSRSLIHDGVTYRMVGALAADALMCAKPVGKGYVTLAPTAAHPWGGGDAVHAHEFHYSTLVNVDPHAVYAYRVVRGHGIDGRHDGIVRGNTLASYAHLRSVGGNDWAARFVAHVRRCARLPAAVAA